MTSAFKTTCIIAEISVLLSLVEEQFLLTSKLADTFLCENRDIHCHYSLHTSSSFAHKVPNTLHAVHDVKLVHLQVPQNLLPQHFFNSTSERGASVGVSSGTVTTPCRYQISFLQ